MQSFVQAKQNKKSYFQVFYGTTLYKYFVEDSHIYRTNGNFQNDELHCVKIHMDFL